MTEKLYFIPVLMEISERDCVRYVVNLSLNHNTLVQMSALHMTLMQNVKLMQKL